MSGFEAGWLALREAADARARNPVVAQALAEAFAGRQGLAVVDLGAGSGNNLRATAPLLPAGQHWRLVDHDAALLARARTESGAALPGVTVETVTADLAGDLDPLFDPAPDLVTASALFDLAGAEWIGRLLHLLSGRRIALHAVLSYTGHELWEPPHPLDGAVLTAFHADQRRDKGLGPALGPQAHDRLAAGLRAAGYRVLEGSSDWVLEAPRDAGLIAALAAGAADATAPALGPGAREWAEARRHARRVVIGHRDLLALPPSA